MPEMTENARQTGLTALLARREANKDLVRIENSYQYAGSSMNYYCETCGAHMVLDEGHTEPSPRWCPECKSFLMSAITPEQLIVEVRAVFMADFDPAITIFRVAVTTANRILWPETFGSVEQLRAYLLGLKASLSMVGYFVTGLEWNIPPQWTEPAGKRWTITRGELTVNEDLDSDGEVISRD